MKRPDTYTITVVFTRNLKADLPYIERLREKDTHTKTDRYYAQELLRMELLEHSDAGMAGAFEITACDLKDPAEIAHEEEFARRFPTVIRWSEVADEARAAGELIDYIREGIEDVLPPTEKILHEYYEIDSRALERERDQLFELARTMKWPEVRIVTKEGA